MIKHSINITIILFVLCLNAAMGKTETVRVTTKSLSELVFAAEYSAPAKVVSLNDSSISAEVQGRAIRIEAEVGDTIKLGQLLVSLDCRNYINTKQQALASLNLSKLQLNFAQKQFNRNQRLLKRGVLSQETFDRSESDLLTSKADIFLKEVAIESANLAITKCKIYAPFSGQVTRKFVQQGQLISPGSALIQLLQTNKLEIEAELSPLELKKARNSPSLKFIAESLELSASIRTVLKQLNSNSNTQQVRLSSDSPDSNSMIAGLNGRLVWKDGSKKMPPEYLIRRGNSLGVMVNENGIARFRELKDAREGQPVSVSFLGNTQVIIVNRYSVADGQAVVTE